MLPPSAGRYSLSGMMTIKNKKKHNKTKKENNYNRDTPPLQPPEKRNRFWVGSSMRDDCTLTEGRLKKGPPSFFAKI